jgi:hypothetical protein
VEGTGSYGAGLVGAVDLENLDVMIEEEPGGRYRRPLRRVLLEALEGNLVEAGPGR